MLIDVGLVKDDRTLRELAVVPNAKMMVVGSTMGDVMTVQPPSAEEIKKLQTEKPCEWTRETTVVVFQTRRDTIAGHPL